MTEPVSFFTFHKKTAFMPLRHVYPECLYLIRDHTQVEPLQCFATECPANQNCAEIICRRVDYLFTEVMPEAKMLFLYFDFRNQGFRRRGEFLPSLGAGLFNRELDEPRWMKLNRWGFKKCLKEGTTYQWIPDKEFLLMSGQSNQLITMEDLLRTR